MTTETENQIVVRSDEHAKLREGRITGSNVRVVVHGTMKGKNTFIKTLSNSQKFYSVEDTPNMPPQLKWGHACEPWARGQFWDRHPEYVIERPAFVHPGDNAFGTKEDFPWPITEHVGYSPDGLLIGPDGVCPLEIKNPFSPPEVVKAVVKGAWRARWTDQCDLGMLVTGAPYCWLVVGDKREPESSSLRYNEYQIMRDDDRLATMVECIVEVIEKWKSDEKFTPPGLQERVDNLDALL